MCHPDEHENEDGWGVCLAGLQTLLDMGWIIQLLNIV